eukprot:1726594-Rhodomonas_salina.2
MLAMEDLLRLWWSSCQLKQKLRRKTHANQLGMILTFYGLAEQRYQWRLESELRQRRFPSTKREGMVGMVSVENIFCPSYRYCPTGLGGGAGA